MLKFIAGISIGLGVTLAVALTLMPSPLGPEDTFGRFVGNVHATFLEDGLHVELKEDFQYVDPNQKVWLAPAGSVVDGASIPQAFWSFIGGPFAGQFRNASIIHDVGCQQMTESSDDVHRTFYFACRCAGVSEAKAKAMFYAVSRFGPTWDTESMLDSTEASPPIPAAPPIATSSPMKPPVPMPVGEGPGVAAPGITSQPRSFAAPRATTNSRQFAAPSPPKHHRHSVAPSRARSSHDTAPAASMKKKHRMRAKSAMATAKRAAPTKQEAEEVFRYFETHDHKLGDIPHVHIGQSDPHVHGDKPE
jgi:hypothetical protein